MLRIWYHASMRQHLCTRCWMRVVKRTRRLALLTECSADMEVAGVPDACTRDLCMLVHAYGSGLGVEGVQHSSLPPCPPSMQPHTAFL